MKYHVNSTMSPNGPIYYVEDADGNRKPGSFDCERSAQAFADYLNDKEKETDGWKKRFNKPREATGGNR